VEKAAGRAGRAGRVERAERAERAAAASGATVRHDVDGARAVLRCALHHVHRPFRLL
jgi:antirestriction protein ArdC